MLQSQLLTFQYFTSSKVFEVYAGSLSITLRSMLSMYYYSKGSQY